MARPGYVGEDMEFGGNVTFTKTGSPRLPAGLLGNDQVAAGANIADTKVNNRRVYELRQAEGTDATAEIRLSIAYKAQTVLAVMVAAKVAATGGDKKATVDVKKSTAGGATSSILTAAYDMDNSKTSLTVYSPTVSGTPTLIATDILELSIAVSGTTGSQNQGLVLTVICSENGT